MSRPRYNVITASEQGTFIINKNDTGVADHFSYHGSYEKEEINLLVQVLDVLAAKKSNLMVLDIGANIGTHSINLADHIGNGKVYAFEPQRLIFNMLAGNVAIASLENVFCFQQALGSKNSIIQMPQFDFSKPFANGSVEFGENQVENIGQERLISKETVECITIDSLNFDQLDFAKIDVEGMELEVLEGGYETIKKFNPILFIEFLKSDKEKLKEYLHSLQYTLYQHTFNFLCLPKNSEIKVNSEPV